jgi:hypothetical protein
MVRGTQDRLSNDFNMWTIQPLWLPFVTPIFTQYQPAGRRAITSTEGPEPG